MVDRVLNRVRLPLPVILALSAIILASSMAVYSKKTPPPLSFGVHTLHPDDNGIKQVRDLGAQYLVQVFSWSEIEPTSGEYHWEYTDWLLRASEYYGLRVIARIDKPPAWALNSTPGSPPTDVREYADFVAEVASRYRGRIAAYIIWNEPNLSREWGNRRPDAASYVQLLRAATERIRLIDPDASILSAGLAPTNEQTDAGIDDRDYLRAMYAAGARDAFDIMAVHPYGFANPPDDPHGAHKGLNLARLQDLRDIMVANGDSNKPVWITEFGYTTTPSPGSEELVVTEEQQAEYLVRGFEFIKQKWDWVQLYTVWNLPGEAAQSEGAIRLGRHQPQVAVNDLQKADLIDQEGYGLLRPDGSLKPAYGALEEMPKGEGVGTQAPVAIGGLASHSPPGEFLVLARDAYVHLGDSEYPAPWVPLYGNRNPSIEWDGEVYLRASDLANASDDHPWTLTMEVMQANDLDSNVSVNGHPTKPAYLPVEDFTSVWVTARFQVLPSALHVGHNVVSLVDGKAFPSFQQLGFTWDDMQVRNVILTRP